MFTVLKANIFPILMAYDYKHAVYGKGNNSNLFAKIPAFDFERNGHKLVIYIHV